MEDKWYIKQIGNEDFIYHCFTFSPEIQEHTFLGKEFTGMDQVNESKDLRMFERVADAGPDGFMPQLVDEIKLLMGEGNYKYDGYEIGEDEFSLYFFIKKKLYKSILKKFGQLCEYHEFRNLVYWEEKE